METQKPLHSKTVLGAICTAVSTFLLTAGPALAQQMLNMDEASAREASNAAAVLLNLLAGQLVMTGRANANIKPLG